VHYKHFFEIYLTTVKWDILSVIVNSLNYIIFLLVVLIILFLKIILKLFLPLLIIIILLLYQLILIPSILTLPTLETILIILKIVIILFLISLINNKLIYPTLLIILSTPPINNNKISIHIFIFSFRIHNPI